MRPAEYSFTEVLPCVCVCVSKYVCKQETPEWRRSRPEFDCCATEKKDKVYSVTQTLMLLQHVLTPYRNLPLLL